MSRWTWWRETERRRTRECPVGAPMLQAYLDGELDAADAGRVRAHVAECHACARELSLYQRITSELASRGVTDEAALARLKEFAASIAERESTREPGPDPGRTPGSGPGPGSGSSAVPKAGG
jgi:anti-sigma factor RsiW